MSKEAMNLALEALENCYTRLHEDEDIPIAIAAIKQARSAPVQEPPDDGFTQALIERDEYHAIADELAEMIAKITGEDIGEHTSANFPWRNALDAAENWLCHPPAAQPAPVQEPIAFFDPQEKGFYWAKPMKIIAPITVAVEPMPLYTPAPSAQRQWVGLTDEEAEEVWHRVEASDFRDCVHLFAQAIEAALRSKNT